MLWTIEGAYASTGKDATLELEAQNEHDAVLSARSRGVLIAKVIPHQGKKHSLPLFLWVPLAYIAFLLSLVFFSKKGEWVETCAMLTTVILLVLAAITLLYGIWWLAGVPGRIAERRNHPAVDAIRICGYFGLFFGMLFWIVALTTPSINS